MEKYSFNLENLCNKVNFSTLNTLCVEIVRSLHSLDLLTRGMQASEITVLGARSGIGKSAFLIQTTIANCQAGNGVLLFSLEMTQEQILRRIIASVAQVPFCSVRDTKWGN